MAALEENTAEVRAVAKYVRTAPRKAMLVADQIRGLPVAQAQTILAFSPRAAARDVAKVLASAVANAEANHALAGDDLYVSAAEVGSGPTLKRWRARARGRAGRIRKRTCHITVRVAPREEAAGPVTATPAVEPEKPKRARRAPATAPSVAPVEAPVEGAAVEAPTPETAAAEGAAPAPEAPKRARSRKAAPAKAEAPSEPAAEKPARAPRKKAAATPAAEPEKQKRTTRKKATEPEPKEGADS